jgi:outer membrane lipoprotein LolB
VFANALFLRIPDKSISLKRYPIHRAWLLSCIVISACVTTQSITLPEFPDWETRKSVLAEQDTWDFSGRLGVSAGSEGFNGKLWWYQDGVVFRARISGPLGVGTVFINGNGPELTVTDNDGVATRLQDAEADLRRRYGWTIPVSSLRHWALGIPDPSTAAETTLDESQQLIHLQQGGWQVDIREYREGGGQQMPRRLTASSGDVKVRLVIDEWTFRR